MLSMSPCSLVLSRVVGGGGRGGIKGRVERGHIF